MRLVDRDIKLVASGSSNYGADWIAWNRTVLNTLRNQADYIAIHTYINNSQNDLERFLAWSSTIDHYIEVTAALIRQAQSGQTNPRPLYVAYDEWNVWYRTGNREKLEEVYNFEDALAMGMFFNSFFRHANVVKMANIAQMVNVIAPIMTNKQGLYLQTTYFPLVEYGKQRGNIALDTFVSAPTYKVPNRSTEYKYLDVSTTFNAKDRMLYINVLNRSKDKDLATKIENQEGVITGDVAVWEMNNTDLKAINSFADDKKVRPTTKTFAPKIENNGFSYTFPAHSLTILKVKMK
jgi:alpha-N-arabinofuranosidase